MLGGRITAKSRVSGVRSEVLVLDYGVETQGRRLVDVRLQKISRRTRLPGITLSQVLVYILHVPAESSPKQR
jgi:hypothetical protein